MFVVGQVYIIATLRLRQVGIRHRDALHRRELAQLVNHQLTLFYRNAIYKYRTQRAVVIARIIVHHALILTSYHHQQGDEEGDRRKLQAQQQEFPQTMTLMITLEGCCQGDVGVDIAGHETRDEQYDDTCRHHHADVVACSQQCEQRCPREFLHEVLCRQQQQGSQQHRQQQQHTTLQHDPLVDMTRLGTIALMHRHLASPLPDAANDQ